MLFVSFLFAVCSQHEHDFWWNIGLTVYNLLGLLLCEHFPIRNHTLPATCVSFAPVITVMRDFSHSETRGLVNNYGERGQQNVKNYRPQTFCTLPQDRVNFHPPPTFLRVETFHASPQTSGTGVRTAPIHVVPPSPFRMAKTNSGRSHCRGKTSLATPLPFCSLTPSNN